MGANNTALGWWEPEHFSILWLKRSKKVFYVDSVDNEDKTFQREVGQCWLVPRSPCEYLTISGKLKRRNWSDDDSEIQVSFRRSISMKSNERRRDGCAGNLRRYNRLRGIEADVDLGIDKSMFKATTPVSGVKSVPQYEWFWRSNVGRRARSLKFELPVITTDTQVAFYGVKMKPVSVTVFI